MSLWICDCWTAYCPAPTIEGIPRSNRCLGCCASRSFLDRLSVSTPQRHFRPLTRGLSSWTEFWLFLQRYWYGVLCMVYVVLRQLHYRLLGFPLVFFQAGMQSPLFHFLVTLSLLVLEKKNQSRKAVIHCGFSQPGQNKRKNKQC